MCLKIRCDGESEKFCKFFWEVNKAKAAIDIANNPVHHDRTKHIEIDRHFIKEKLDRGIFCLPYVKSASQIADILTKGLPEKTLFIW
jgi:hypothetical protein